MHHPAFHPKFRAVIRVPPVRRTRTIAQIWTQFAARCHGRVTVFYNIDETFRGLGVWQAGWRRMNAQARVIGMA